MNKLFIKGLILGSGFIIPILGGFILIKAAWQSTNPGSGSDNNLYINGTGSLTASKRNELVKRTLDVEIDAKNTTATHNGNFGGYKAMNDRIQTNGCAGYHVCSAHELSIYLQKGGAYFDSISRFNNMGLTSQASPRLRDCDGRTSALSTERGNYFANNGGGNRTTCNSSYKVTCCKIK